MPLSDITNARGGPERPGDAPAARKPRGTQECARLPGSAGVGAAWCDLPSLALRHAWRSPEQIATLAWLQQSSKGASPTALRQAPLRSQPLDAVIRTWSRAAEVALRAKPKAGGQGDVSGAAGGATQTDTDDKDRAPDAPDEEDAEQVGQVCASTPGKGALCGANEAFFTPSLLPRRSRVKPTAEAIPPPEGIDPLERYISPEPAQESGSGPEEGSGQQLDTTELQLGSVGRSSPAVGGVLLRVRRKITSLQEELDNVRGCRERDRR